MPMCLELSILSFYPSVYLFYQSTGGFPGVSVVKNPLAMQETQEMGARSLGGKRYTLGKEIATCSSILAWEIPWTENPCGIQSRKSQRV